MLAAIDDIDGYRIEPAGDDALGEFRFLVDAPLDGIRAPRTFAVATVSADAATDADALTVLVLRGAASGSDDDVEDAFLSAMAQLPDQVGGSSSWVLTSIELAVEGSGTDTTWISFFHEGTGYVILSGAPTSDARDAYAGALAAHLHEAPLFDSIAVMEGPSLPERFAPLLPPCTWGSATPLIFTDERLLEIANDWRGGEFPLAQHFAIRSVSCNGASGSMSIVELHPEFVAHVDNDSFLDGFAADGRPDALDIDGTRVVRIDEGPMRWLQGRFLYQLVSDTIIDSSSPDGRPALTPEAMEAIARQVIAFDPNGTAVPTTAPTTAVPTMPPTGWSAADIAAKIGCTGLTAVTPLPGMIETATCTLDGLPLTIATSASAPTGGPSGWSEFCVTGGAVVVLPGPTFVITAPLDGMDLLTGDVSDALGITDVDVTLLMC